jgi:hypothetical protein
VHWRAGKRELREAYERLGGAGSERLTYVLHQLLDRAVRSRYDAMPPGDPMLDRYVASDLARAANLRKSRLLYRFRDDPEGLARYLVENDLEEFGEDELVSLSVLDDVLARGQDKATVPAIYPYGHYLWRTTADDPHRLARWQEHLVRAASAKGLAITIAIGLHGLEPGCLAARVGYLNVIFLRHDAEPDHRTAEEALAALPTGIDPTHTTHPTHRGTP